MNLYNAKKEEHFIEAYQKHFTGLTPKRVLEIGVQGGGSLKIWRDFFPEAEIVGIDIDPLCKEHEGDHITVQIGSQSDVKFLESLGDFDIIIDDGGHTMSQQQISMKWLLPQLREGGVYVIEDLHTSYWIQFKDIEHSTIEEIKSLIDDIHTYADQSERCIKKKGFENKYRLTSMAIYPGIAFLFK